MDFILRDIVKEKFISQKIMKLKEEMEIADELEIVSNFCKILNEHQITMKDGISTFFDNNFQTIDEICTFLDDVMIPGVNKSNELNLNNPVIDFLEMSLIDKNVINRPNDLIFFTEKEELVDVEIKQKYIPYTEIIIGLLEKQNKMSKQLNEINRLLRIIIQLRN